MSQKFAPIALFVYNRPWHTRQTVEALLLNKQASESDLFIYSDAPKKAEAQESVNQVREYIHTIKGFRAVTIIERNQNFGLANSIITGVTEIVDRYGQIIVMEDDLVCSPYFIQYMNDALYLYKDENQVCSISGYVFPVNQPLPESFFIKDIESWGWATWKRSWTQFEPDEIKLFNEITERNLARKFDMDGSFPYTKMLQDQVQARINSWAIRWQASCFLQDKLTLHPGKPLIHNIGHDGSGTHCSSNTLYGREVYREPIALKKKPITEDIDSRKIFKNYLKTIRPTLFNRIINKLKYI